MRSNKQPRIRIIHVIITWTVPKRQKHLFLENTTPLTLSPSKYIIYNHNTVLFHDQKEDSMNFEQMLLQRESCRAYKDTPVSREHLCKICEAGRLTPSACNSQPWKFLIVDEAEAKDRLCDALCIEGGKSGAPWRKECPAFIALVEQKAKLLPTAVEYYKDTQYFAQGDVGMASLNMCYQAMELGLSTCILGLIDQKKMQAHFGISEEMVVRVIIAIGYRKEDAPARPKVRKSFDDVVCINEWK